MAMRLYLIVGDRLISTNDENRVDEEYFLASVTGNEKNIRPYMYDAGTLVTVERDTQLDPMILGMDHKTYVEGVVKEARSIQDTTYKKALDRFEELSEELQAEQNWQNREKFLRKRFFGIESK